MCGIAGVASFAGGAPPTRELLKSMCDQMVHRGPDDDGYDVCQGVGLGLRPPSTIALAGAHQPLFHQDGSVRVVFNGEIYNYRDLRRGLEAKGHRFATVSDTEVIVHLWEEYGADCPKHLNGMVAIALYDARQRKLLLARDHLGIKPLYYSVSGSHLVFGSEVKVLLASGLVERELDIDALGEFLAWEYVPGSGTLIKAVRKLRPAQTLVVDLGSSERRPPISISTFWDIPGGADANVVGESNTRTAWMDAVDETVRRCVQRQLVSDVPLGAFLSGGVDSSLVVSAMGPANSSGPRGSRHTSACRTTSRSSSRASWICSTR